MSKKRKALEADIARLVVQRDKALEPLQKKRRLEEKEVSAPYDADIADLLAKLDEEKEKSIWLVMGGVSVLSAYRTEEKAKAQCPRNSRSHVYNIKKVPLNRIKEEITLEDGPVSK